MRRAPILAAVMAAAGLLAGCDQGGGSDGPGASGAPSVNATIQSDDGGLKITSGDAAKANLPPGLPLYPGATVVSNISAQGGGNTGGTTIFQAKAAPAAVVDFYRQKAKAAGLSETTAFNAGERVMFSAAQAGGGRAISVVATAQADGSQVQLTWTDPGTRSPATDPGGRVRRRPGDRARHQLDAPPLVREPRHGYLISMIAACEHHRHDLGRPEGPGPVGRAEGRRGALQARRRAHDRAAPPGAGAAAQGRPAGEGL